MKKEELKKMAELACRLEEQCGYADYLRGIAEGSGMSYRSPRVQGGGAEKEAAADILADTEKEIEALMHSWRQLTSLLEDVINSISDSRMQHVLRLRYIQRMTWPTVCRLMKLSRSHTMRIYRDAVSSYFD